MTMMAPARRVERRVLVLRGSTRSGDDSREEDGNGDGDGDFVDSLPTKSDSDDGLRVCQHVTFVQ